MRRSETAVIDKLAGVHPKLKRAVAEILGRMAAAGFTMVVTDGVRTTEEQKRLYAQGRTTKGPNARPGSPLGDTVTKADGVRRKSNHQLHADGCGHAVDCTFVVNGTPRWSDDDPWETYGDIAKANGLAWGGDWKTPDRPHIELRED